MGKTVGQMGRRKFFMLTAMAGLAVGFLRELFKSPKIAVKRLFVLRSKASAKNEKVSLHPAQFYRKINAERGGGQG